MHQANEVCVVGMGYVGLTLAVTLADIGYRVWGYERQPELVAALNSGRSPMFEPGVEDVLRRKVGDGLTVAAEMPQHFEGTVVICVSTPVGADNAPELTNLMAATDHVAQHIGTDASVVVRSTVPVRPSRGPGMPLLRPSPPNCGPAPAKGGARGRRPGANEPGRRARGGATAPPERGRTRRCEYRRRRQTVASSHRARGDGQLA